MTETVDLELFVKGLLEQVREARVKRDTSVLDSIAQQIAWVTDRLAEQGLDAPEGWEELKGVKEQS